MSDRVLEKERIKDVLTKSPMTAKQIAVRAFPEDSFKTIQTEKVEAELYHLVAKGDAKLVDRNKFSLPS